MFDLYRIESILQERNAFLPQLGIKFVYPFFDPQYLQSIRLLSNQSDSFLGLLNKEDFYKFLQNLLLVVSVPSRDSSPRSVYEAIFSGCSVATTYCEWIDVLPKCMRDRVIVVDLKQEGWLAKAYSEAKIICSQAFSPSIEAMNLYDQNRTMMKIINTYYSAA